MIKARIWVIDDEDSRVDKVLGNFDMKPSEIWSNGTVFGDIMNYKFTFTISTPPNDILKPAIRTQ